MPGAIMRIEGTTTAPPRHIAAETEALTYTLREPVGVVGQIVPWNVPLSTAILKLAPALAAGCTVVVKPSEETPLSVLALGQMIMDAGFPAGVVNIVNGLGADGGRADRRASGDRQSVVSPAPLPPGGGSSKPRWAT